MFNNIGSKMKKLATFFCWCGIIASVIATLALWSAHEEYAPTIGTGFLVLICGIAGSWLGSVALYAFGQITDDIHAMRTANDTATLRPKYQQAAELMKQKKYDEAVAQFEEIYSFQDSAVMIQECRYRKAIDLKRERRFKDAIKSFTAAGAYKDSAMQILECWYKTGEELLANAKFDAAYDAFEMALGYSNADEMLLEVRYLEAKKLLKQGDKETAFDLLLCMPDYKDVLAIIEADPVLKEMYEDTESKYADDVDDENDKY